MRGRSDEPDSDPEISSDDVSPRVLLGKLQVHTSTMRKGLEAVHGKVRTIEASQSSTVNRIESLEGSRKILMAVIAAVATAAMGALWTAYTATRASGEKAGRDEQRLEQLEHSVERITDQLQRLWTFRSRQGDPQP